MGREIVYCSQCGVRILEKDLAAGRAFTVLDKVFCAECRDQAFTQVEAEEPVPAKSASKPAPRAQAPPPGPRKMTVPIARTNVPGRPPVAMSPRGVEGISPRRTEAPEGMAREEGLAPSRVEGAAPRVVRKRSNPMPLYIGSAVGLVVLVVFIVVFLASSGGTPGPGSGGGTSKDGAGPRDTTTPPPPKITPDERAAAKLAELLQFATINTDPAAVVKRAVDAEKEFTGTASEEAYRAFRKRWERKIEAAEADKKIDAILAKAKALAKDDPPGFKRHAEVLDLIQEAKKLALEHGSDKAADVENLRREVDEPYEAAAEKEFEDKAPKIKLWMNDKEFKFAKKMIESFPEPLRLSKRWRVDLTRMLETCDREIAALAAKAAGKEVEKDWKAHLRIASADHGMKNLAKAKESYLKAVAGLPALDKLLDQEKRAVAWQLFYNMGCLYAEESKKLEGAEKTKSVDSAFEYLAKSAEAGVFEYRCGEREHATAKDHWDTDKDLETIRGDARYAELIKKYVK